MSGTVAGDSKEAVAYSLLLGIATAENKTQRVADTLYLKADKDWVLSTYRECLAAVEDRPA